ncbi:MAG: polysaccharide biosynthesis tyrosine autokinase [Phycisphaerae bacterium]|nr:polysaccharide biosynthesis tyrosine autokinase [Phycisphaerae bacterium]
MDKSIQKPNNMMTRTSGPPRPGMIPAPGPGQGTMTMTPKEIMGILRRHLWMIIIFTVLGTIIGGISWFLCDRYIPKYTAVAGIKVSPPGLKDPKTITNPQPAKDIYYQHRFTMASYIKRQNMLEKLITRPKIQETDWFKRFAKVDEEGNIIGDKDKAINKALKNLEDHLSASAPRDQNVIFISMRCGSAIEAKTIVDEMVLLFLQEQRQLALGDVSEQLAERTSQRDNIQSSLRDVQNSLEVIREGTRFARLNLGANQSFRDYMDDKMVDLENTFSRLSTQRSGLERNLETLKNRAISEDFDQVVKEQIETDPIARQMRNNIASLEPILSRQLNRFGEEHRIVQETRAALKQMQEDLANRQNEIAEILRKAAWQRAEDDKAIVTQQIETNEAQLQKARAEYKEIDKIRAEYAKYEKIREEKQALLENLNRQVEDLNAVYTDPDLSTLKSLGPAFMPREKSFPKLQLFLPGGFMLGLLAGLGLAFAIEMLNDLLRTPSDVMRHLKTPLMGSICHFDDDTDIEGVDLYHVVRQAPYSITSECYRQLRTNLKLSGPGGISHKTLLVTSGKAGDGKTTIAVNIASTLLAEERSVLLIDANFRRPTATRLFPHAQKDGSPAEFSDNGLSNYLMGQCSDISQIIRPSGIENLFVVDSGPLPANPTELFTTERMKRLMETCKEKYDYVIIDGPATLVSDSKALASQVDGTILVFNAAATHRGAGIRILRELKDVHANIVGTVLMGVKSRKGGYFREVYRSYQEYQRVQLDQQPV